MTDRGNGIWATDEAVELAKRLDTVIFDVDGVLLDVSRSFRECIVRTVQYYLSTVLEWPGEEQYMLSSETELFKRAGGFNSDWTLTDGAALLFLVKGVHTCDRRAATLRAAEPTLEQYTAEVGRRGGGMDNAIAYLSEVTAPDTMARALELWDRELLQQIHCEYYAGRKNCRTMYGFDPQYTDGEEGELSTERVILDVEAMPAGWKYGIITGRSGGELVMAFQMLELGDRVAKDHALSADDGLHKPDPNGLIMLAEKLSPTVASFVGDTIDDMRTVLNYRKVQTNPPYLACQVLTGPAGEKNRQFFADEGADVIAPDVNGLLVWLADQKN